MTPGRRFIFIGRIYTCTDRIQLPKKSSAYLLKEKYIKEVIYEEKWSMGIFRGVFHELTEKGKKFYEEYKRKKS